MPFQVVEIDPKNSGGNRVLCDDGRFRPAGSSGTPRIFARAADGEPYGEQASNRDTSLTLAVVPHLAPHRNTMPTEAVSAPPSAHRFWPEHSEG